MRRVELFGLIVILALAYGAMFVTWWLGAQLNLALGVGCLAFAGLLLVAEAGLALWAIVRRWADGDDVPLDTGEARAARRARAAEIIAIQRRRSDRLPPVA